jgi:small-conductance mechanosensitive channel
MFLALASLWQDSFTFIARIWNQLTRQFTFGRITVSVSSVIVGVIVFTVTILIARTVSTFIEHRLAKRHHIDPGLRYTICRLVRYVVIMIGTLVGVKQAFALDLTSIAVVFTALSVGIGFGLQYIAADIASGFILLFERPIRVGDRITIGEDEGDVQSINLRATVVTTNDRIAIIVPNSKLVSQRVINWSYGDPRARIAIPVGVADDSDIDLVTKTLIESADGIENVLTDPPPRVQFLKFGDYSLDFRLLVWTSQPRRHVQIRSDINFRIHELFREREIRIPYPTQEFLPSLLPDDDGPKMRD